MHSSFWLTSPRRHCLKAIGILNLDELDVIAVELTVMKFYVPGFPLILISSKLNIPFLDDNLVFPESCNSKSSTESTANNSS